MQGHGKVMLNIAFYRQEQIEDELFEHVVIMAKMNGEWIFCRHKERDTWEFPGGHREPGETVLQAAKRELYEETGAVVFDIYPVSAYRVIDEYESYTMLYVAELGVLHPIPGGSEIAEIMMTTKTPEKLTYPKTYPYLFESVQKWLNRRSGAKEMWDVYDRKRQLTGRRHMRGEVMAKGDYHLVVNVWIQNANGEVLLTRRSSNKGFPNMWECTGGSALAGDDSLATAIREVKEETGLTIEPENGTYLFTEWRESSFCDVWLFKKEFELEDLVLQPSETCDARKVMPKELMQMRRDGVLIPISYLDELIEKYL